MNCFNIRELQGILKRRFFVDLVNSHDYKNILSSTMLGVKYKLNSQTNLSLDSVLFYNWGVLKTSTSNIYEFRNSGFVPSRKFSSFFDMYVHFFLKITVNISSIFYYISIYFINLINLSYSLVFTLNLPVLAPVAMVSNLLYGGILETFLVNFIILKSSSLNFITSFSSLYENHTYFFSTKMLLADETIDKFSFLEHSGEQRSVRFFNSLISYDYKTGHYLGSSEKYYPYLILSFLEVARGIRKPS
jgi:hypothetical protein